MSQETSRLTYTWTIHWLHHHNVCWSKVLSAGASNEKIFQGRFVDCPKEAIMLGSQQAIFLRE